MIKSILILFISTYFSIGCQLVDNSINGQYDKSPSSQPPTVIGLDLKLSDCSNSPLEALPYSCGLVPTTIYEQHSLIKNSPYKISSQSLISYVLLNNTCTGISITAAGRLEGEILMSQTETCSLTVMATQGEFVVQESLELTVGPSLTFSFSQESMFLQEGTGNSTIDLILSEPAPYDTYVEFDIYGNSAEVVTGVSYDTKKIYIQKGQTTVPLDLSVAPNVGILPTVHQQLRLKTGSRNPLPAFSISSYDSTLTPKTFQHNAAGSYHSCGISNGSLFCWGRDFNGQVGNGDGSSADVTVPMQIGVSSTWESISLGNYHTCGIDNGRLFCWGQDIDGQVGNGSGVFQDRTAPVQIGVSITWDSIALGGSHTCGLDEGKLFCWGKNYSGQIANGSGDGSDVTAPVQIGSSSTWEQIALGQDHSCGIDTGRLYCWGLDSNGQVGNGSASNTVVSAPLQIGASSTWESINLGEYHTCGIDDGRLFCWGRDHNGQIGNGSASNIDIPAPLQIGVSNTWQSIAVGHNHNCGINSGSLFCWGRDSNGQVGNGSGSGYLVTAPMQIAASSNWERLALGMSHTCGADSGRLFCWGLDSNGQVGAGNGSSADVAAPLQVGSSGLWGSMELGYLHTCGIDDGRLFCWGNDFFEQIGNGSGSASSSNVAAPIQVGWSRTWGSISLGYYHTCGIDGGYLFCWGMNGDGQLGNGTASSASVATPLQIESSNTWQSVELGNFHTCGLNNSRLFCWGKDTNGQVGNGNGSSADVKSPLQIGSSNTWESIALGGSNTCGIDNGRLFCWGPDSYGQVGNGDLSSLIVTAPLQIGSSSTWESISVGYLHTCGIDSGRLFCWGLDSSGQVGNGNGSSTDVTAPVQIGVSNTWTSIALGKYHSCGINTGRLYCWGPDDNGQVGNGSASSLDVSDPLQIGAMTNWQSVALGDDHTCGINNGHLFCWGLDSNGQVGNSSSILTLPFLIIE